MEVIFSIVLVFMAFLFYFSSRKNLINRWCAFYLAISSIGVMKEAFLYQFIPWTQSIWGDVIREDVYLGIYSVLTWISYSFAAPAAIVMGLYFYGLNHRNPKILYVIKRTICIPALILSFIYIPVFFRTYQLEGKLFWWVYSGYNLILGVVMLALIFIGVHIEKSQAIRRHKIMLGVVILPATIYTLITIFVIHPLGLERLFKAWQWNLIVVAISGAACFVMAFKNGFLGLRLSVHKYDWDSEMDLAGRAADYTSHMLKNQTSKIELCIEQLKDYYDNEKPPEELAILSRSISNLKNYTDRMKRHSQSIRLYEESCILEELLTDAMPVPPEGHSGIMVNIDIPQNVFWVCDKSHMTEVLSNIIMNAAQSIRGSGTINITGEMVKSHYLLRITDTGIGINGNDLQNIFTPYFTTKSTGENFGLGLSYCKNVIEKHGGKISAKSKPGKGTTITISMPSSRVDENEKGASNRSGST